MLVAPLVAELVGADASLEALEIAKGNVPASNGSFVECSPDTFPFPDGYFDLIFSLGVLHHLPDTQAVINSLVCKLALRGRLLLYLYYAFDNRPVSFRALWKLSDLLRRSANRLPFFCGIPCHKSSLYLSTGRWPALQSIFPFQRRGRSSFMQIAVFYVLRTDALDRFGTKLEKHFTKQQIMVILRAAYLEDIRFWTMTPIGIAWPANHHETAQAPYKSLFSLL